MSKWWLQDKERLAKELDAFSSSGIEITKDNSTDKFGILSYEIKYPYKGKLLKLIVRYPDNYPYFRPKIIAPELELKRHQSPNDKGLCLTLDRTHDWNTYWTVVDFLEDRLEEALEDQDEVAHATHAEQAAPETSFIDYPINCKIYWDGDWECTAQSGTLNLCLDAKLIEENIQLNGFVEAIKNKIPTTIHKWTGHPIASEFKLKAPFIKAKKYSHKANAQDHFNFFWGDKIQQVMQAQTIALSKTLKISIAAVLFNEETGHNSTTPSWLFFLVIKNNKNRIQKIYHLKSHRAGPNDFKKRVPVAQDIKQKNIMVLGAGSIGAPIILDLAKLGAKLSIVDNGIINPAQTIRWPIGIKATDRPKVRVLYEFLKANYPHARVEPIQYHIGGPISELDIADENENIYNAIIDRFWLAFHNADIIVDATAESGVQHFMSSMAKEYKKTYIYVSASPGVLGGYLGYFSKADKKSGCWVCLQHSFFALDDTHEHFIPTPPADESDGVLPAGCAHETFTGAAYDLQTMSNQTVRLIVQQFEQEMNNCFLRMSFNGPMNTPMWEKYEVPQIEGCEECIRMK